MFGPELSSGNLLVQCIAKTFESLFLVSSNLEDGVIVCEMKVCNFVTFGNQDDIDIVCETGHARAHVHKR